ncbi:TetR/AcrR family transcriptional regulator [Phenylobacterium sp. J367]|uniref:TetR/AcrR family transcriptional regulator n=1 Tax=Phenylobacterium sp. J367 TaxID=2898435 RepID=UPI0021508827|nr:TetR/AcrR family transcriptional regulator [Phenylobacterium sp. J367]MCR5879569.1 TetR/AcrR family transcriptional regulator [Phenylobacterium sp. J367]
MIEAAADIFYEKGYDAATLQEIAERVGILKGSIYYYIKTKADLRDHLLLDVHNRGLEMIRAAADSDGSSLDRLSAMIRGHVTFFCNNVAKTTVYLHELRRLDAAERNKLLGAHAYRDVFQQVIEKGQSEGLILPELDPKLTSQAMLSSLNSVYHWYRSARSPTVVAEYFVTTIIRGHATDKGILATYAGLAR